MRSNMHILLIISVFLIACRNYSPSTKSENYTLNDTNIIATYGELIHKDTANKMILSYLESIDYQNNDTDLQSIIFDAGLLRSYLNNSPGADSITHLKIMFAHSLRYINAGGRGKSAGYREGAFTVVIAGYDASGNYIYYPYNQVIDNGMPCPTHCPPGIGPLFPNSIQNP